MDALAAFLGFLQADPFRTTLDPDTPHFWISIGMAVVCGGIIGLEREVREKPMGIRTSILVCLGADIYVGLGAGLAGGQNADPTRVIGQVVTGIGFLGAGVILSREGEVKGVTSAATVWVLAAIGCAIGLGHYLGAFVLTIVTVAALKGIEWLENAILRMRGRSSPDDS